MAQELPRVFIKLDGEEMDKRFENAPIYAKYKRVRALQLTVDHFIDAAIAFRREMGIYYDIDGDAFILKTFVMEETHEKHPDGRTVRTPKLESENVVAPGMWIITNPIMVEGDTPNRYAQTNERFHRLYEADEPEGEETFDGFIYRPKGIARIIPNFTLRDVEIDAPWGQKQYGGPACYFCAPYDRAHPDDLAVGRRYILSGNDFQAYKPVTEVLGENWNAPA